MKINSNCEVNSLPIIWQGWQIYFLGLCQLLYYFNFVFGYGSHRTLLYFNVFSSLVYLFSIKSCLQRILSSRYLSLLVAGSLSIFILGCVSLFTGMPYDRYLLNIVYFLIVMLGCVFLIEDWPKKYNHHMVVLLTFFFAIGVLYHFYGVLEISSKKGYMSNPHFLAIFVIYAVTFFLFQLLKSIGSWKAIIWGLILLILTYMLLKTQSRPAWLAFLSSAAAATLVIKGRRKWILLFVILSLAAGIYSLAPHMVANRVNDLVNNIAIEERVFIWADSIKMQMDSSLSGWLFGHGPGSFRINFESYNTYVSLLHFPHNFILELIFESGILGFIIIFSMYLGVICLILKRLRSNAKGNQYLSLMLFGFSSFMIFTFFTVPFYSKYTILLQIPIISYILSRSHESESRTR